METNNEKIGFELKPNEENKKKNKLSKHLARILVLTIFVTMASFFLMFLKTFSGIFMIFLALTIIGLILIPIAFTFGLILISDGFRAWVGNTWGVIDLLNDVSSNIDKFSPLFRYFGFIALGLSIFSLFLAIIGRINNKNKYLASIILASICLIISIVLLMIYYKNGETIF